MKKYFLVLFVIFLFNVNNAGATSGACSYHDGVNCDIGPDLDGSVICNDGWKDSSVSYFDSVECANKKFYCTQEEYDYIKEKYNINSLMNDSSSASILMEQKYKEYNDIRQGLSGAALIYGSAARNSNLLLAEAAGAANVVSAIQDNIKRALDLAEEECLIIGKASYYKRITETLKEINEKIEAQKNVLTCPNNSYLYNEKCYCDSGYVVVENQCILDIQKNNFNNTDNLKNKSDFVVSPANLNALLDSLNEPRRESEEDSYKKLIETDLKDFKINASLDQKNSLVNFAVYGISSTTQILGSGERRALIRDYLDTVGKAGVYWEDINNMANGKKIIARNLEKEKAQVTNVLTTFKKIFGRSPEFSNYSDDLAWNTMMYRIRFPRNLNKELHGIEEFKKIFKHSPGSPFDWAVVRVLGYVK